MMLLSGTHISADKPFAALAQLDRVFGYEPKGRGFESLTPRKKTVMVSTMAVFFC